MLLPELRYFPVRAPETSVFIFCTYRKDTQSSG
jgi:hypothetical protein